MLDKGDKWNGEDLKLDKILEIVKELKKRDLCQCEINKIEDAMAVKEEKLTGYAQTYRRGTMSKWF